MRTKWLGGLVLAALLAVTGCGNFFQYPGSSTTTIVGSTTADFAYVVNTTANTLSEYALGSGTLAPITGSPITLETGFAARSVVVAPGNGLVYVGGSNFIDCFTVGSTGALTEVTGNRVSALSANFVSLTTSVDGKWLLGLDSGAQALYVYGINTSTGALTLIAENPVTSPNGGATSVPSTVKISPSSNVVAVTLGSAGSVVYAFNDSTGAISGGSTTYNTGYSMSGVTFDLTSAYVYFTLTDVNGGNSGVESFAVSTVGVLSSQSTLATSGGGPAALVFNLGGTYLYAANKGDSTVSGYTATSGALTTLGTAVTSVPSVTALTRDNGSTYIVAVGSGGGNDVTLYALDALQAGKLDSVAVAATGSTGAVAVAATHPSTGL